MSTMTCYGLIGEAHMYHDGMTSISHHLMLHENSRPVWELRDVREGAAKGSIRWVPSCVERIFEEGLLLIGLFVVEDEELLAAAAEWFTPGQEKFYDLSNSSADWTALYAINRKLAYNSKLIISVFDGSSVHGQVNLLANYPKWAYEVCLSSGSYGRYNPWA